MFLGVQNTSFCQSDGGGIKSLSVTTLVYSYKAKSCIIWYLD